MDVIWRLLQLGVSNVTLSNLISSTSLKTRETGVEKSFVEKRTISICLLVEFWILFIAY